MGSDAHVIVVGGPAGLVDTAQSRIDELEQRWSRFLPDSEVSALNRSAGTAMAVSAETRLLVERAVEAWRLSAGLFDPTVLGAVVRAGYDRSLEDIASRAGTETDPPTDPRRRGAEDIEIEGDTVRLPARTGFDPGGIGKGLAADLVTAELLDTGARGACVNLGGDVRVAGDGPEEGQGDGPGGGGWSVAVEHAWQAEPIATIYLDDGAVATSTTLLRRWTHAGGPRHHLIDPHTGLPSDTDVNHATVVAGQAWAAEVLAKAVLLHGARHAFDILGGGGAEGLIVTEDGDVHASAHMAAYLGPAVLPERLRPQGP